jgi:tryptophan-rich sensory protein
MGRAEQRRSGWALLGFVLLVAAVAGSGAYFQPGEWYAGLIKPAWTPPNWLFPVAWTLLYLTIALAGWLVWRERGAPGVRLAFSLYGLQLVLNALWSWLFFGLHRMDLGLADILALWLAIAATIVAFFRIRPAAGLILLPYLVWVGFAALLNLGLWRLNG